ncbi:BrnA antitoxin family protein [Treponema sp. OMZ 787]|uniref:BrnA antitoxin family protein n=1 Tax=Treponema sp. OMZ 787 TaxID=2563669 RepID=UPI0020A3B612|nr:BrnA antitoxin family protein [Treponema sp. OMZ 787]UTC61265.1 BrnA antitoxin family protein [Treponema sp. OMZ 787]
MIISKKLTAERLEEIKNHPISYDDDSPKLTQEQISRLKPFHEAYWTVTPVKKTISIKIDADILAALQSLGRGYQTRINAILREAVMNGKLG